MILAFASSSSSSSSSSRSVSVISSSSSSSSSGKSSNSGRNGGGGEGVGERDEPFYLSTTYDLLHVTMSQCVPGRQASAVSLVQPCPKSNSMGTCKDADL